MYLPLLEAFLDSLYEVPNYIIPGFIYKRTFGIIFVNNFTVPGIVEEFTDSTPAAISIEHTWNNSTREIDGTVSVTFDTLPESGDFRIGLMIVEDNVKGGEDYDQRSYFNTSDVYPELNGLGNPISEYEHMDVFRDTIVGGIPGRGGIIPQVPEVGKSYSVPFNYTVPAKYIDLDVQVNNLKLIAFISYFNGEVINADEKKVIDATDVTAHTQMPVALKEVNIHRLNSKGISFNLNLQGSCELSLFTSTGQKVADLETPLSHGLNSLSWPDKGLSKGIYFLHLSGNHGTTAIPVVIYK